MRPENPESIYRLSPVQEGILFHALDEPENALYVRQLVVELWERLRSEAPQVPAAALDAFGGALARAEQRVTELPTRPETWREALESVLAVEAAFAALARTLEEE